MTEIKKVVEKTTTKDGVTIIKTTTITIKTTIDDQPNPSNAPPDRTTPTVLKPTMTRPIPVDKQPNPSKAPLSPPDATTPKIIKSTKPKPTIIKPTPVDRPTSTAPSEAPDTTDVPTTSSKNKNGTIPTEEFELDCLNEHNRLRALHGCPPLTLNKNLSLISKKWAIQMANKNSLEHSQQNKYGENLYMCSGFTLQGSRPAQSWYNEIKDYNYKKPGFSMATGHFTQLIWKDSTELGVGVIIRGNTTWVAAHYNPPGNVKTMFEKNVPRPLANQ